MYERSFWDSFDGHAGERLATFAPHFPLICLALTPIMISTSMTNRVFTSFRCSFGVPTATKWMTLKWRVILLTVALITLTFYNVRCWDSVNLFENSLYDRFSASLQLENPDGFLSFIFYLLMPFGSLVLFTTSILDVFNSRSLLTTFDKNDESQALKNSIIQTISVMFFYVLMCIVADGEGEGRFSFADAIIFVNFYFVSCFPFAFKKTNYDFKRDFGDGKFIWDESNINDERLSSDGPNCFPSQEVVMEKYLNEAEPKVICMSKEELNGNFISNRDDC